MDCRPWQETPDHLAEFFFVLEYAEGAIGKGLQIESRVAFEGLIGNEGRADVLEDVEPHRRRRRIIVGVSDHIAAQTCEQTIRCKPPWSRFSLVARSIFNFQHAAAFDGL